MGCTGRYLVSAPQLAAVAAVFELALRCTVPGGGLDSGVAWAKAAAHLPHFCL